MLDYIVVLENVLQGSIKSGHTLFGYTFISDHRVVYIYIPMIEMIDTQLEDHIAVPQSGL